MFYAFSPERARQPHDGMRRLILPEYCPAGGSGVKFIYRETGVKTAKSCP